MLEHLFELRRGGGGAQYKRGNVFSVVLWCRFHCSFVQQYDHFWTNDDVQQGGRHPDRVSHILIIIIIIIAARK